MDTAEIDDQVNVIEIGPGIGALTEFLAERAAEVDVYKRQLWKCDTIKYLVKWSLLV